MGVSFQVSPTTEKVQSGGPPDGAGAAGAELPPPDAGGESPGAGAAFEAGGTGRAVEVGMRVASGCTTGGSVAGGSSGPVVPAQPAARISSSRAAARLARTLQV